MLADQAANRVIALGPASILDIGAGTGQHAKLFADEGIKVTMLDDKASADIRGDYLSAETGDQDAIWCSHVLEHQRNPGLFCDKLFADLKFDGLLAITVPPFSSKWKGGHVTVWCLATLVYQLVLSGFDCSRAWCGEYGYNISVIVRKRPARLDGLTFDRHDVGRLARYFPAAAL